LKLRKTSAGPSLLPRKIFIDVQCPGRLWVDGF
jgi:hypothetical protein